MCRWLAYYGKPIRMDKILFQGQYYAWQKQPRGTPLGDAPAYALITFIENHDQVANTRDGARLSAVTSPGRLRAASVHTIERLEPLTQAAR